MGVIIQTLKDTGLYNDTIIVFHADHGYHLGEHGEWEKKSNFDLVVRVSISVIIHNSGLSFEGPIDDSHARKNRRKDQLAH